MTNSGTPQQVAKSASLKKAFLAIYCKPWVFYRFWC